MNSLDLKKSQSCDSIELLSCSNRPGLLSGAIMNNIFGWSEVDTVFRQLKELLETIPLAFEARVETLFRIPVCCFGPL